MNEVNYWFLSVIAVQLVLFVLISYKYAREAKKSTKLYNEAHHLKVSMGELYRWCAEFEIVGDVAAYINHHFQWTEIYFPDDDTVPSDICQFRSYLRDTYKPQNYDQLLLLLDETTKERDRLNEIINSPQKDDFIRAVSTEAEHQRQTRGAKTDSGKKPSDWFWLIGYLAGKALNAHIAGNKEKAEHHIITTAAACANWHRAMFGKTDMRPGLGAQEVQHVSNH